MRQDPLALLSSRTTQLPYLSYKLSGAGSYGFDVPFGDSLDIDEGRMALKIPFADGNRRDGVGDVLEVGGIDTSRHRQNPVVLFDHAKTVALPIALAEDPESKAYTVSIDPVNKSASLIAHFYQGKGMGQRVKRSEEFDHALFCEQLFDLAAKRYLRAGSIGYQVVKAMPLRADYETGTPQGLHLLQVLMLEGSLVVMPANQDTVRKMLDLPQVCGKPLSPYLVKSLSPYAPTEKKTVSGYRSKGGYFDECPRDAQGHCKPQGKYDEAIHTRRPKRHRGEELRSESGDGYRAEDGETEKPELSIHEVDSKWHVYEGKEHLAGPFDTEEEALAEKDELLGVTPQDSTENVREDEHQEEPEEQEEAPKEKVDEKSYKEDFRESRDDYENPLSRSDVPLANRRQLGLGEIKKDLDKPAIRTGRQAARLDTGPVRTETQTPKVQVPQGRGPVDPQMIRRDRRAARLAKGVEKPTAPGMEETEWEKDMKEPKSPGIQEVDWQKTLEVRRKYRKAVSNSNVRRWSRSKSGRAIVHVMAKDADAVEKMATEKGLEAENLGGKGGIYKFRLKGGDTGIDEVAKMFGRSVKSLSTPDTRSKVMSDAPMPLSAQVLKRLHEDASLVIQEYDSWMGALEHPEVKEYLKGFLGSLSGHLDSLEELGGKAHPDLKDLFGGAKDMDTMDDAGVEAGSDTDAEESEEEVVEGMRQDPAAVKEEAAANTPEHDSVSQPGMESGEGGEEAAGPEEQMPPKEVAEEKAVCPGCGKPDCKCSDMKMDKKYRDLSGTEATVGERIGMVAQGPMAALEGLKEHEQNYVREAQEFLSGVSQPNSMFGEEDRMKAYHFSKLFEEIGKGGLGPIGAVIPGVGGDLGLDMDKSQKSLEEVEEKSDQRKMCKEAASLLRSLSGQRAFGDPHRRLAGDWANRLGEMLGTKEEEGELTEKEVDEAKEDVADIAEAVVDDEATDSEPETDEIHAGESAPLPEEGNGGPPGVVMEEEERNPEPGELGEKTKNGRKPSRPLRGTKALESITIKELQGRGLSHDEVLRCAKVLGMRAVIEEEGVSVQGTEDQMKALKNELKLDAPYRGGKDLWCYFDEQAKEIEELNRELERLNKALESVRL